MVQIVGDTTQPVIRIMLPETGSLLRFRYSWPASFPQRDVIETAVGTGAELRNGKRWP